MHELFRFHQYRPFETLAKASRKSVGIPIFPPGDESGILVISYLQKLCRLPEDDQLPYTLEGFPDIDLRTLLIPSIQTVLHFSNDTRTAISLALNWSPAVAESLATWANKPPPEVGLIGDVASWIEDSSTHRLSDLNSLFERNTAATSGMTNENLERAWLYLGRAFLLFRCYRGCLGRMHWLFPGPDNARPAMLELMEELPYETLIKACNIVRVFLPKMMKRGETSKASTLLGSAKSGQMAIIVRILERPLCIPEGIKESLNRKYSPLKLPQIGYEPRCSCSDDPNIIEEYTDRRIKSGEVKRDCPRLQLNVVEDLFVVREELLRYEEGDVAYIENVLAGEERVRKHRRLKTSETKSESEIHSDQSEEFDHSVSDKSSLQQQIQQQQQENLKLDAGVNALSKGTGYTVSAHANIGLAKSKSKSMNVARNHARDVVSKAVSKLQEKTRTLEYTRVVKEVEEKNRHTIINRGADPKHTAGIFYWVNKVTQAQVYNYGRRIVLTMYIPEPAATYRWLRGLNGEQSKENPPKMPILSPDDIKPETYYETLRENDVFEPVLPPPTEMLNLSSSFSKSVNETGGGIESASFDSDIASVVIPEGYQCEEITKYSITVTIGHALGDKTQSQEHIRDQGSYSVSIAGKEILSGLVTEPEGGGLSNIEALVNNQPPPDTRSDDNAHEAWKKRVGQPLAIHPGQFPAAGMFVQSQLEEGTVLPVGGLTGVLGLEVSGFSTTALSVSGSFSFKCKRTDAALKEWQLELYNLIMSEYARKLEEFNERQKLKREARELAFGNNPLLNREIERNELKRHVIALLMCNYFDGLGAIKNGQCNLPEINVYAMERNEPLIRFFEQVLEWSNMSYLFYPSYWARKCKWHELLEEDSGDPLFDKFLTAGAARVQIPLRPGVEEVFAHYLTENEIWADGAENLPSAPPFYANREYVSMVQEVKESKNGNFEDREGNIVPTEEPDIVRLENSSYYWDESYDEVHSPNVDDDRNREILLDGEVYRVVDISQVDPDDPKSWLIQLDRPFHRHEDDATHLHSFGAVFVGAPWEVVIPTKLVYLQNPDDKLPSYPLNGH